MQIDFEKVGRALIDLGQALSEASAKGLVDVEGSSTPTPKKTRAKTKRNGLKEDKKKVEEKVEEPKEEEKKETSREDFLKALRELAKIKGKDYAYSFLETYGAKKSNEVKTSDYADFVEASKVLIKEAKAEMK